MKRKIMFSVLLLMLFSYACNAANCVNNNRIKNTVANTYTTLLETGATRCHSLISNVNEAQKSNKKYSIYEKHIELLPSGKVKVLKTKLLNNIQEGKAHKVDTSSLEKEYEVISDHVDLSFIVEQDEQITVKYKKSTE